MLLCLSRFEVGGITEKRMGLTMSGWQAKSDGYRAALSGRPPWANLPTLAANFFGKGKLPVGLTLKEDAAGILQV
jgi:hypothetical protein